MISRRRLIISISGGDPRGIPPTMDSEGYYHIYTYEQMLWVNNLSSLSEKNYKLMNDIVCNSDYSDYLSWETTPPMNEMLATNGGCIQANYFDGNGHTIYGMYSYNVSANDAAFFGSWASGTRPTIKNVRLKNCTAIGNTSLPLQTLTISFTNISFNLLPHYTFTLSDYFLQYMTKQSLHIHLTYYLIHL